ncbi:MAG: hypothetical protein WC091_26220 [Sulfuricellaceae bacterium]
MDVRLIHYPLRTVGGRIGSAHAGHASDDQTRARTGAGTLMPANGRTSECAHSGTDSGALQAAFGRSLGRKSDSAHSPLLAFEIVGAKLVKGLSRSRQGHDARTGRHGGTGKKQWQHQQRDVFNIHFHKLIPYP